MPVTDDTGRAADVERQFGHPEEKWSALKTRIQGESIKLFKDVQTDWLDVLYTLDRFRSESVVPRGMGNPKVQPAQRLAAIYRGKGNWYGDLIALLLGNWTSQRLAPRSRIEGFSQLHQIDVAWPDRTTKPIQDPLICLETKLTGAPGYGSTSERKAMADWTNRRKELKFAATDLKLNRRASETTIDHWDVWRQSEKPKCYFLWGARLTSTDDVQRMVREVQALTQTYLDGAAIVAWRLAHDHYEPISVTSHSPADRVSSVDDLLRRIATEIKNLAPAGTPPPPQIHSAKPVKASELMDDLPSES